MQDKEQITTDEVETSLDFLSSFCGIMEALGVSDGLKEAAGTDIATFAREAQYRVCYLRDHMYRTKPQST